MKTLAVVAVQLLVIAVATEVALGVIFRLRDPKNPVMFRAETIDAPFLYFVRRHDPDKGINADGLETEKGRQKPPGKFRVIMAGASVAGNLGAETDEAGRPLLETVLNRALGTDRIEVVNGAVPAYVVEQVFLITQLVLQHYQPDLIISVDGYNDLMSFHANRHEPVGAVPHPPMNWRSFRVIENAKLRHSFWGRFEPLFKNSSRGLDAVARLLQGQSDYDYSRATDDVLRVRRDLYLGVVEDLRDLCAAKGIDYVSFLQPFEDYAPANPPSYVRGRGIPRLNALYALIDTEYAKRAYTASLTGVLDEHQEVYRDGVHVTREGHTLLAEAIARALTGRIRANPAFRSPAEPGA
jgi:lysophospholipase L1-like esterase